MLEFLAHGVPYADFSLARSRPRRLGPRTIKIQETGGAMSPADLPWWGWFLCAGGAGVVAFFLAIYAASATSPEEVKAREHFETCPKCNVAMNRIGVADRSVYCDEGRRLLNIDTSGYMSPIPTALAMIFGVAALGGVVIGIIRFVKWVWEG